MQVLWGYQDPVLEMVKSLISMLEGMGFVLPPLPSAMMGPVALQLNGTAGMLDTGNLTMLTGKQNVQDAQKIVKWKGEDTSPYWLTKYGNMINGTDGSRAPPSLSSSGKLYMFVPQLCRSLYLQYSHDTEIEGIKAYAFSTTKDVFANATANPDNAAFCSGTRQKPECWDTGLLPMSTCRDGAPIFMSAPHFWEAVPDLVDSIEGMHPNETLHRTFMNIEPMTGIVLGASKRLQINVMTLNAFASKTKYFKRKHTFLPVVYVEEGGAITPELAGRLKHEIFNRKELLSTARYICVVVGLIMVLCALALSVNYFVRVKKVEESVGEPTVIYNEKATIS